MYRIENDLIGELEIPSDAYYGIQSQRGIDNFNITGVRLCHYPTIIKGLAYVKWAAVVANYELGLIKEQAKNAVVEACKEVLTGKYDGQFQVDMIQGGAGTSTNMTANEVIANIALEKMGYVKGDYAFCSPHDVLNCAQSTNDAYPAAMVIAISLSNSLFVQQLKELSTSFRNKGKEYENAIKMGRTHLQDAVPMTFGQMFSAYADTIDVEIEKLNYAAEECLEISMGATAIGTGINAIPGYAELCTDKMAQVTGLPIRKAKNFIEATPDTSSFVSYSSAVKRLAVKLSKIMNDLRMLSSGPRCGLNEINLPGMQPGSSIMPGKVNPVMPESVNQTCFRVIGNDLAVTLASEAGQLQLNVMEPVILYSILESVTILGNALDGLRIRCIDGITINEEHCKQVVLNSIGIVTALNPYIGYKKSTEIAKEALDKGLSVYDLVLERKILTKEQLDTILDPKHMTKPTDLLKFQPVNGKY